MGGSLTSQRNAWAAGWLVLITLAALPRPAIPVDETRYLAVAWEMWSEGQFLVPQLNGAPYPDKPPLYFWLIHAGWLVFGVNDLWPRIVPALAAAACLALVGALARLLWPDRSAVARMAPMVLAALPLWLYFVAAIMFDMLLSLAALVAWVGVALAWRRRDARGFALVGIGVAFGLLAKGPAILVHVLPAVLLAPCWAAGASRRWASGLCWGGLAVLAGCGVGLAWAWPAGVAGGETYQEAIWWGQTAGRVNASFAHREPFWFYLPVVPLITAPWIAWPRLWRSARAAGLGEIGVRFCAAQALAALLVFSAISGKQPQYLLPEFALVALLVGRYAPEGPRFLRVALATSAACLMLQIAATGLSGLLFDVSTLSERLAEAERNGSPLANVGKYRGQFHYYGRLEEPIQRIRPTELEAWLAEHPTGRVVVYLPLDRVYAGPGRVLVQQRYRGKQAALIAP